MSGEKTDALLRKLLEKIVWPEEKLDRIIQLLTEIKELLVPAPPPVLPPRVILVQLTDQSLEALRDKVVEAKGLYGQLRLADDLYVEEIDLGIARPEPKDFSATLALPETLALTIFRATGTFDLYLQKADEAHKITFNPIMYPQTFLLDNFKLKKVYITNTAQAGQTAVIIAWRKTS